MEQRRGGASEIIPGLTMEATGVRGATAQPAERDRQADTYRQTDRQADAHWQQLRQIVEGAALEAQSAHHPPVGVLRAAVRNTEEPPGGDGRHAGEPRLLRTQGDIALFS